MFKKVRRERLIGLFCLLLLAGSILPGQAQKDNRLYCLLSGTGYG